jgi:chemotaxis protein methyltransferase WspC
MSQIEFETLLKNVMGLNTPSIGSAAIERAVRIRMAILGLKQADDYRQQLHDSTEELQELIEAVVVPETWFFRDPEAFTTLAGLVSERRRSTSSASVFRLLSVPCSTGEEPYSIAMSLLEGGFSPQQLQLDAVDISSRALACAMHGVYGPNSFRGASVAFRDRYFQAAADKYAVEEALRRIVTFRQDNILSPDFSISRQPYDVIFCRNLLIYFDRSTQERVMKTLALLLKPDGVLFVGPAEAFLASCSGFASVNRAMSFAFRRTCKTSPSPDVPLCEPKKAARRPVKPRSEPATRTPLLKAALPFPSPPVVSRPPQTDLETARRLADAGRLQEAAAWCESDLLEHGPSAETCYLSGLVRDAIGDRTGAAGFYRKVIYLEPDHVEGLMHLALVNEKEGDTATAERLRERARRVERRKQEMAC